jgi:ankyrin repeat protein
MSFKYERFLVEAIEQFHLHKIITYVKHGHNVHIKNNRGQNLLIYLLKQQQNDPLFEKKRFQIFQFLILHCHLDVQTFDYYGKNVLNWATNLNCTQEALYLLRSYPGDTDILTRDQSGSCSLHYAIEHGNEILIHAIVDYLLQYRLRFDIKDGYNNTPEELARKLGYDHIGDYLAERSRTTIFLSREIPLLQQRPMSNKSKTTINTKVSSMTLSLSSSSLDPLDFYNLMESKIETAKVLNDWKAVAALRAYKRTSNGKKFNQLRKSVKKIYFAFSQHSIYIQLYRFLGSIQQHHFIL